MTRDEIRKALGLPTQQETPEEKLPKGKVPVRVPVTLPPGTQPTSGMKGGPFGNVMSGQPDFEAIVKQVTKEPTRRTRRLNTDEMGFKEAQDLYLEDGSINPAYNTSKLADISAGMQLGAKLGMGQNMFFQLGAIAGGALGGALNKNLAGKQLHEQDMEEAAKINAQVEAKTAARIRAEQLQRQMNMDNWKVQRAAITDETKQKVTAQKDYKSKVVMLQSLLAGTPPDSPARSAILEAFRDAMRPQFGELADEMVDPQLGIKLTPHTTADGFEAVMDQFGNIRTLLDQNNEPIVSWESEVLKMRLKSKIKGGASYTPDQFFAAAEAALIGVSSFRSAKPGQRTALIYQLASRMADKSTLDVSTEDIQTTMSGATNLLPTKRVFSDGTEPVQNPVQQKQQEEVTPGVINNDSPFMSNSAPTPEDDEKFLQDAAKQLADPNLGKGDRTALEASYESAVARLKANRPNSFVDTRFVYQFFSPKNLTAVMVNNTPMKNSKGETVGGVKTKGNAYIVPAQNGKLKQFSGKSSKPKLGQVIQDEDGKFYLVVDYNGELYWGAEVDYISSKK